MAGSNTNYHAVIFKHIKINPSNVLVSIIAFGMWKKIPVYDSFVEGAEAGMKTVLHLIPDHDRTDAGDRCAAGFGISGSDCSSSGAGRRRQPIPGLSVSDGDSAAVFLKCRDPDCCWMSIRNTDRIHASE